MVGDAAVTGAPELAIELERADELSGVRRASLCSEVRLAREALGDQHLDQRGHVGEDGALVRVLAQHTLVALQSIERWGSVMFSAHMIPCWRHGRPSRRGMCVRQSSLSTRKRPDVRALLSLPRLPKADR